MDALARDTHRAVLVDRARLLRRLYVWYAVQVHQTKYLIEIGVGRRKPRGRWARQRSFGVPGQIIFGHLSDRIGREWVWAIGCLGFAICFAALIALQAGTEPGAEQEIQHADDDEDNPEYQRVTPDEHRSR